jgi:hypothetical protein
MSKDYFIMLNSHDGESIMPITDDEDDVQLYETEEDAIEAMRGHPYAEAYGFEIFKRGDGNCF